MVSTDRPSSGSRLEHMQACVRHLLYAVQEDPCRQGLIDTPKRVAKATVDMVEGYRADPTSILNEAVFDEPGVDEGAGGLVLVRDVDFASLSQDTLLPFYGRCHIAYVPSNGVVLGLSKLARLVKLCAKQLHTQHSLGMQLLHYLQKHLRPQGTLVVVQARHLDYMAVQPPQLQLTAVASGSLAAAEGDRVALLHRLNSSSSSSSPASATLAEALELLGLGLNPEDVRLVQDAANQMCLLLPNCSCHQHSHTRLDDVTSSSPCSLGPRLVTAAACSTCGTAVRPPHVIGGLSASVGDLHSPEGPATPDPSEGSDVDASEQNSELFCAPAGSDGVLLPQALSAAAAAALCAPAAPAATDARQHQQQQPLTAALSTAVCSGPEDRQQQQHHQQQPAGPVSMEDSVLQLLAGAGIDTTGAAIQTAARRHVMALLAATSGYHQEHPSRPVLQQQQQPPCSANCVLLQGPTYQAGVQQLQQYERYEHHMPFMSQCEHHLLPFHGTLHIQYLLPKPSGSDGGCCCQQQCQPLTDLEAQQLVQCYTKRLQVQERITQLVAAAVQRLVRPVGVMVVVQAVHMCMVARGVENHSGSTSTRSALGLYECNSQLRCEFLKLVRQQQQQEQGGVGCASHASVCGC